jgi:hypothetical protein
VSLVADDAIHVNGQDSGLGPYQTQDAAPPFLVGAPIEQNLRPEPPHEVTGSIPPGASSVTFEALDTQGEIYGNTAVYLVRDCGVWLDENAAGQPTLHLVSFEVDQLGVESSLYVVTGLLSELRLDHDFARATCLGSFPQAKQATDTRPDPTAGECYYYLVRGTCSDPTYGESHGLSPDPRDALDGSDPCF